MSRRSYSLAGLSAALSALCSCAHSPETRIFTIDAVAPVERPAVQQAVAALRVTGFRIPRVLDKVEVVWHERPNRIEIDDFAHWGAPLGQLARAAFVQDLAERLPEGAVFTSDNSTDRAASEISVEILSVRRVDTHFEADVIWNVSATPTRRALVRTVQYSTSALTPGAQGEATAIAAIIGLIADDVVRTCTPAVTP